METQSELAERFDRSREQLRAMAIRMLGSPDDAEDAVQETWLRASHAAPRAIVNMTGWLTTLLGRVCLEMLRARRRRGGTHAGPAEAEPPDVPSEEPLPETRLVWAESVGLALLVVLDTLGPAERTAFVLHDLFGVPFEAIATIVERTPVAAKKLASRARHRVRGVPTVSTEELVRRYALVERFLAASRAGDPEALLAVLAPEFVRRADPGVLRAGAATELRGARRFIEEARLHVDRARFARPALVDGTPGAVVAPGGRLLLVLRFTFDADRITGMDVIGGPRHLRGPRLALIDPASKLAGGDVLHRRAKRRR
ncbi:sigma-70 family RNA polymerase sigma factor [Myxococcus stipitatus]|uniref:sigma-70 family RNA polymerase sigma factor n=1 Tax=Myxococcus stipitatus TaxID=83455 RepID=UPI001F2434BC|nr:sigma-70 family RNA polymerase sigma factor [Myxococcus stipitatus]MCE9669827.1 sigma-70 family RNA polymerase sigma factor [Myxococcus stipitatus]